MVDRAQPGARGSVVRNIELGETTGQFSSGWIVPAATPTLSSRRFTSLDTGAYAEFDATHANNSLDVTIGAGEGFCNGWFARDQETVITLSPDTEGQTVVLGWNASRIYDDQIDATRDGADTAIVALDKNTPEDEPTFPIWEFDTDATGVVEARDMRRVGSFLEADTVDAEDSISNAEYENVESIPDAVAIKSAQVYTDVQGLVVYNGSAWERVAGTSDLARRNQSNISELIVNLGEAQFELGLERLDFGNGIFDVFANEAQIESLTQLDLDTDTRTLSLNEQFNDGLAEYGARDYGFIVDTMVFAIDADVDRSDRTDIKLVITDENGNQEIISIDQQDTIIETLAFETLNITTQLVIERDDGVFESPEIDDWAVYYDGRAPAVYYEPTITGVTET